MKTFLSLGAGVQSSTLALMIAKGEIPMVDGAVFADTQAEPAAVYKWLDWLETQLPYPLYRVSKGSLTEMSCNVRTSKKGNKYTKHTVPAFIIDSEKRIGMAMRQCTLDFKIDEIHRQYNRLRDRKSKEQVVQLIGISLDEYQRMKPSRRTWVSNEYPLVDRKITRQQCLQWMLDNGYPMPPRSACVYCPYHSNHEWRNLKENDPESFERAVEYEKKYQAALTQVMRGTPYLHRSCKPLDQVDFGTPDKGDAFNNECEGMCGV
jgi:hypothetical protein